MDFRLPPNDDRWGVHPAEYIEGFPRSAEALDLTFSVSSPEEGRELDSSEWENLQAETPYWIPGTNVIGAVGKRSGDTIWDTLGHGTGVASVSGGLIYGRGTPNVIVVSVRGFDDGFWWAAHQPWIDLISLSYGGFFPFTTESSEAAKVAADSGKITCVASGNLYVPLALISEPQGPSHNVHVGSVDPTNKRMKNDSGWPNDVVAITDIPAARVNSMEGYGTFTGTSAAAPHACALFARALSRIRERLRDFHEGPHDGGLAKGASLAGALADGVVTRLELEDAVESTAVRLDTSAGSFIREGYGLVDPTTIQEALRVIFGDEPRPTRDVEDSWQQATDLIRDAFWGNSPPCLSC